MSSGSDSEDDRDIPTADAKKPRVHYGSLEDQERQRREEGISSSKAALLAGIQAGNINISASMSLDS